jgi:hypothetical protein
VIREAEDSINMVRTNIGMMKKKDWVIYTQINEIESAVYAAYKKMYNIFWVAIVLFSWGMPCEMV